MSSPSSSSGNVLLRSARREAALSLLVWLCALVYSVGYCTYFGYGRPANELTFVFGFPDWVFYGIVVPWGVCYLVSALFAFVIIQDAPLVEDSPEVELGGDGGSSLADAPRGQP